MFIVLLLFSDFPRQHLVCLAPALAPTACRLFSHIQIPNYCPKALCLGQVFRCFLPDPVESIVWFPCHGSLGLHSWKPVGNSKPWVSCVVFQTNSMCLSPVRRLCSTSNRFPRLYFPTDWRETQKTTHVEETAFEINGRNPFGQRRLICRSATQLPSLDEMKGDQLLVPK